MSGEPWYEKLWNGVKGVASTVAPYAVKYAMPVLKTIGRGALGLVKASPLGAAAAATLGLGGLGVKAYRSWRNRREQAQLGGMADTYDSEYGGGGRGGGAMSQIESLLAGGLPAGGGGGGSKKSSTKTKDLEEKYAPDQAKMQGLTDEQKKERSERMGKLFKEIGLTGPSLMEQLGGTKGIAKLYGFSSGAKKPKPQVPGQEVAQAVPKAPKPQPQTVVPYQNPFLKDKKRRVAYEI
jgi:hypothetical protein